MSENRPKILIVTPIYHPDIGGPASYISGLQKYIKNIVGVVSFGDKNKYSKDGNISIVSTKQSFLFRQIKLFLAIYKQLSSCDLVYIQGPMVVGLAASFACRWVGKPYIVKFVGDENWEAYKSSGGKLSLPKFLTQASKFIFSTDLKSLVFYFRFKIQSFVLHHAHFVICPGKYLQSILDRFYRIEAVNIPNAIDIPQDEITYQRKKNQILFVGRLVSWKNLDQVIYAFGDLMKQDNKDWSLVIVGDGDCKKSLQNLVGSLGLDKKITFLGKKSSQEVSQYMAESEFLVLNSSYEGLSHTLLEGIISGCKIIASDIVANRDVLRGGDFGKLVPVGKISLLAEAFIEEYPQEILENAKDNVLNFYTWQNHLEKLERVFKLVIEIQEEKIKVLSNHE